MPEELPFISYSTKKHVDSGTLSKIRSHAQQRVQDQKWSKRSRLAIVEAEKAAAKASEEAAQQSNGPLRLVFESKTGRQIKRQQAQAHRVVVRKKKTQSQDERDVSDVVVIKRATHSLGASPGERPDPFGSFPVVVDAEVISLLQAYMLGWKWDQHTKGSLFQEQMSRPILARSCLAIAHHVVRNDEQRSLMHENMAIRLLVEGINQLNSGELTGAKRTGMVCALVWSIIRLATIKVNQGQLETSLKHLNALSFVSPEAEEWRGTPFAMHFQSAIASLLLANLSHSDRVRPLLHLPYGPMLNSAVEDVKAQGFPVPELAVMAQPSVYALVQEQVSDAILALTALYNTTDSTPSTLDGSMPHVHAGRQSSEAVKVALRLAKHITPRSSPLDEWDWRHEWQECVRFSTLIFTWTFGRRLINQSDAIYSAQRYTRAYLTPRLINRLFEESTGNKPLLDLLLWIMIVCGSASPRLRDKQHYVHLLKAFIPEATKVSYLDICRVGERLPWIEPVTRSTTEDFWDLVTSGTRISDLDDGEEEGGPEGRTTPGWLLQGHAHINLTPRPSPRPSPQLE